jgi:pimeloyl-[acyl-carrier protein] methyl ester esterase
MSQTWIFFRGLSREASHWGEFRDLISSKFPEDQVLFADLPGTGKSSARFAPRTIGETVDSIRNDAKELHSRGSQLIIVGLSMGGMVAMDWALRYPDEVKHLVLINSSCRDSGSVGERFRWHTLVLLLLGLIPFLRMWVERKMLLIVMNNGAKVEAMWKVWRQVASERVTPAKIVLAQLIAAASFKLPDRHSSLPCTVISSTTDRLVSPSNSEFLHRWWNANLVTHPTAGHDLPADDGDWLLDELAHIRNE